MANEASGFECPPCSHLRSFLNHLGEDNDGRFVELVCQSCEHAWTERL